MPGPESATSAADVYNALTNQSLAQQKARIENKFAPLETAIKAQNALAYSGRSGGAGLFLRSFSQLPVAERQRYMANPANREFIMSMLDKHKLEMNNPQSAGSFLTPEYLHQFGIGQPQQEEQNPLTKLMNYFIGGNNQKPQNPMTQFPTQQSQNAVINPPQQPQVQNMPDEYGAVNQATPQEVTDIAQHGNEAQLPEQAPIQTTPTPAQQENKNIVPVTKELTPKERDTLNAQLATNNLNISTETKTRADATIAFEKFLQLHRKQIGKVFNDAFKYSQLYGRGKNWLDKFKRNQPEEYANYIKAKNSLVPLLANGLRRLEAMGMSHEAQEDARNQITAGINALDVSPDTAREVFNSHMKALADLSHGVMTAAEPQYPGVRFKLAGITPYTGNYIPMRIKVIYKGQEGTIPEDQWQQAQKKGYKRA